MPDQTADLTRSPNPSEPAGPDLDTSAPSPNGAFQSIFVPICAAAGGLVLILLGRAVLGGGTGALVVLVGLIAVIASVITLVLRRSTQTIGGTGFWLATLWLVLIVGLAAFVGLLPLTEGRDPANALDVTALLPPDVFSRHPLGTDTQGLDILSGLLYGARVSLTVAVGGVLIGSIFGGLIGMIAGFRLGATDAAVGFITDVVLSFPALILLLALVTVLQPNTINVTVALGVLAIPGYIRLSRANTIKVVSRDFVVASRTLGARNSRIMLREVLPNVAPSLLAYSFIVVGFLIVAEASLSFLGLGIQRPNPTWGNLIAQGEPYLNQHPSLVVAPAFLLFLTVVSMNSIGQRLQQKWGL